MLIIICGPLHLLWFKCGPLGLWSWVPLTYCIVLYIVNSPFCNAVWMYGENYIMSPYSGFIVSQRQVLSGVPGMQGLASTKRAQAREDKRGTGHRLMDVQAPWWAWGAKPRLVRSHRRATVTQIAKKKWMLAMIERCQNTSVRPSLLLSRSLSVAMLTVKTHLHLIYIWGIWPWCFYPKRLMFRKRGNKISLVIHKD